MIAEEPTRRWTAHPYQARVLRAFVFLTPIVGSVVFVHFASRAVPMPTSSFVLFVLWWVAISGLATGVLIAVDRVARRLLPLVALLNLTLVFPDEAPSRFKVALRSNTVETLEERVARAQELDDPATSVDAAEHLLALVAQLDAHDRITRGHSERVRAYAQMIGEELHLKPEEVDALNWAALVHDVGKLEIPAEILNKDGAPTDEEWIVLRKHPEFGEELVAPLRDWLGEWAEAVGQHHERWDGLGYPRNLSGDEISLAARIVAVADVFDVITSARSYKRPFSSATARNEIANCAGTYFDPKVVRAFLNISLGRLRLVMGPLSWLAHAPILARLPLTPAIGTLSASMATVAAAVAAGILATSPSPGAASLARPLGHAAAPTAQAPANRSPIARDDTARTGHALPVTVAVLANDTDPDGDPLSVVSVSIIDAGSPRTQILRRLVRPVEPNARAGRVQIAGRRVRLTPSTAFTGTVTIRYAVSDGRGGRATALVTIKVAPPASHPAAVPERPKPTAADTGSATAPSPKPTSEPPPAPVDDTPAPAPEPGDEPAPVPGDTTPTPAPAPEPTPGNDTPTPAPQADPVNAAPTFSAGADETVPEDSGPQTISGWAHDISPGATAESGQHVSFVVTSDNAALFAGQPGIDSSGTLAYQPAANAHGVATVTVRAHDDGGTANGGSDTSAPQTFTITVTSVNDAPVAFGDVFTVLEDDSAGVTFDVLANDTDADSGDTLSVASYDGSTIANGTLTDNGGGSFTYVPDAGFSGSEMFSYAAKDTSGATASAIVTISVTAVQHDPVAGNDAYVTQQDTEVIVAAPGIVGNDGDADGDAITLDTTPVVGPQHGLTSIAADGTFKYLPDPGFTGTDSLTYRISDGTGRTADGTVTITVSAVSFVSGTYYFTTSGPAPDIWDMTPSLPAPGAQLADLDGDGNPGLTIRSSDGHGNQAGTRFQIWTYATAAPIVLNGPLTLSLWSSEGLFGTLQNGTLFSYLYDCTPGGATDPYWAGCTTLASNVAFESPWNTSLLDWGNRSITIGSVNATIAAGHELRIRLLFHGKDLWLMTSAAYPSSLVATLGP